MPSTLRYNVNYLDSFSEVYRSVFPSFFWSRASATAHPTPLRPPTTTSTPPPPLPPTSKTKTTPTPSRVNYYYTHCTYYPGPAPPFSLLPPLLLLYVCIGHSSRCGSNRHHHRLVKVEVVGSVGSDDDVRTWGSVPKSRPLSAAVIVCGGHLLPAHTHTCVDAHVFRICEAQHGELFEAVVPSNPLRIGTGSVILLLYQLREFVCMHSCK